jgi:hypothetical protein
MNLAFINHSPEEPPYGAEPTVPSFGAPDVVQLGMDVHKPAVSVGLLNLGHERADVERV